MPQETKGGTGTRREGRELALKLLYREELTAVTDGPIPGIEEAREEALAFSRVYLEEDGYNVIFIAEFVDVEIDDKIRTAMRFTVEQR